jgi:leucyl-tRNA synthetase
LKKAGFSFDFSRLVDTTDPKYYRWTQWIFLKLYEHGLVYKSKAYVNFCPSCKVVLSNEESQGGKCDRCDNDVVQMDKDVWFLKITEYADKLLAGLDDLESNARIRSEQEKWIGRSKGAYIYFPIDGENYKLKVFTTRPDTIYGATFMVVAPEHPVLELFKDKIENLEEINRYKEAAKLKTEFERIELAKDKSGVLVLGVEAINPLNNKRIPIYISDYVMITYGTGAIMAVPAHDTRDYEFATKYNLEIVEVIKGGDISKEAYIDTESGILINSPEIDGLDVEKAKEKIINYLENSGLGQEAKQYRMKDWAFNRQRYWGEPIPIIYCDKCGIVPVPYEDLPVELPMVEKFIPTDTGESPLANIDEFVNCKCPKCNGFARRETDTMPQWAGSSWYFLRYMDPNNDFELAAKDKMQYWGQVDWYNGGMEHVTRHLIYSRFWNQFLYDIGVTVHQEPYKKRTAQGMLLGADNEKMSKSRGNVVNPMEIIEEYGADTLRTFVLFISDYEMTTPWNESGVKGARRFLDKVWRLYLNLNDESSFSKGLERIIHETIKGVSEDCETLKFNTAIAKMMTLVNEFNKVESISKADYEVLLKLLHPFAPHICEELFEMLGHKESLVYESYPVFDPMKLVKDFVEIVLSVNGKVRDKVKAENSLDEEKMIELALQSEKVQFHIKDKTIVKTITVPNKLVNIVVK